MKPGPGKGKRRRNEEDEEEEEEEEYPDNVECEEYDEEDVYVMVELPHGVDGEALCSANSLVIKVR